MNKNYIIINEHDNFSHVKRLSKETLHLFKNGYIEIIDITDPNNPLEKLIFNDNWNKI